MERMTSFCGPLWSIRLFKKHQNFLISKMKSYTFCNFLCSLHYIYWCLIFWHNLSSISTYIGITTSFGLGFMRMKYRVHGPFRQF